MDGEGRSASRPRSGPGLRRLALAGAAAAALAAAPLGSRVEAYLLYDSGALDFIVPASEALRWSPDVWAPGSTLDWEIEDGEAWSLLFDSVEDVAPILETALAVWAGVETADIRWRLRGIAAASAAESSGAQDSRNRLYFNPDHWFSGAALWWERNGSTGVWEITECDLAFPDWVQWVEDGLDAEDLRRYAAFEFTEELGHCLGLGWAVDFPSSRRLRLSRNGDDARWRASAVWPSQPAMSRWWSDSLTEDDRTGASLLRPRAGWLGGTGSLSGVLESEEEGVPYAHVYALRLVEGEVRDPVGAFTNADGEFLIEGLPPGDYLLWALPVRSFWHHVPLVESGAATDLKDAVIAHPTPVEAGATTRGIVIPMRRGRE